MECIFCKIIKKEIPSTKVYEDENTFAFLDINPVSEGHTLVIPKKHFESIFDIEKEELKQLIKAAQHVAQMRKKQGADGVNIIQNNGKTAGQLVDHIHFHVVPRKKGDGLHLFPRAF